MEFSLDTFIISLVNIAVTFVILRRLVYKPVFNYLKQRSERIESDLKKAGEALASSGEKQKKADSELESAKMRADEIMRRSSEDARRASELLLEKAGAEAAQLKADAKAETEAAKAAAMKNMQGEISVIAADIARRILMRELDSTDNMKIVSEYFAEVESNA